MNGFGHAGGASLRVSIVLLLLSCSGTAPPEERTPANHRAVGPGVAFELLRDNPDLVVLDVRPFSQYVSPAGHLERALSLPADLLPRLWPSLRLGRDETVLIYSDAGDPYQEKAMRYFIGVGQRYVVQIDGGLEAWREGGFGIVVEDAPLSPVRID